MTVASTLCVTKSKSLQEVDNCLGLTGFDLPVDTLYEHEMHLQHWHETDHLG